MNKRVLTKDNSKMLQGIAILMMVYNHLFLNGNMFAINIGTSLLNIFNFINIGKGETVQFNFAWFCRICVGIFAFVSGFGIFEQLNNICKEKINIKEMYKYCLKRFLSFYKVFVFCFLFFNICEILTGNLSDFDYSLFTFIKNMLGLGTDYNATLWYIPLYYCMVFISPLVYVFLKKVDLKKFIIGLLVIFAIILIVSYAFWDISLFFKEIRLFIQYYQTIYLLIFMEGMFCGRYKLIEWIYDHLNIATSLLLLLVVYVSRSLLIRAPSESLFDIVLTLPLVASIVRIFDNCNYVKKVLCFFGKYSAYIWYSHAYFYAYLFFNLIIKANSSLFVYLQILAYSMCCGIIFSYLIKTIGNIITKINHKIS